MRRSYRRLGWWVLGLGLAVVVAIAVAPSVIAPYLARRLSAASGASIRIGWINWNPLAGKVVVRRVSIAPQDDQPAVMTLESLTVDVAVRRWLGGERALDALVLRRPWIALRRTGPGDFNVASLFPSLGAKASERAAERSGNVGPPTPWHVGAFRIVSGSIEFRDETIVPVLETSLHLDDATAHDIVLATGGAATVAFHVESRIENEPLELDISYDTAPDSSHVKATLKATGASLARALLYVPLGWQRTSGTMDATITYERRVDRDVLRQHGLRAALTLHDLALTEPWAEEPMLRARRVGVPDVSVDFVKQRTDLGAVQVEDFSALVLRNGDGIHVPLASGSAESTPSTWRTTLDRVTLGKGTAVLRQVLPGPDLIVPLSAGTIHLPTDQVLFQFAGALAGGRVELDGRAAADTTNMTFGLHDLTLAEVPRLLGLPLAVANGRLHGTLDLRVTDAGPIITGTLTTNDVRTAPSPAHPEEVLAWQRLDVALADSTVDPLQLHLSDATATWPYVMVHRRPDGWFPLTLAAPSASATATSGVDRAAAPWLRIDRLRVDGGRFEFYDSTLPQAYGIDLLDLVGSAEGFALSPPRAERVTLKGALDELSPFELSGTVAPERTDLSLSVDRLLLPPLNSYLGPLLGYQVKSGLAKIGTRLQLAGDELDAENDLVLSRFAMRATGPDAVEDKIGTPLSVALTMMKDTHGDIHLQLPVQGNLRSNQFRVGNLVREALGNALLGTLRAPLGFLRGVFRKDQGERFDLQPVPFPAGSATLAPEGESRIAEIARLLARQTALRAVLIPESSRADVAVLAGAEPTRRDELGRARAAQVVARLTQQHGVDPARITIEAQDVREPEIEGDPGVDVQLRVE